MSAGALTRGLLDDAAVFPPGLAPLPDAVAAHYAHRAAPYAPLVGPLVLPATALDALGPLVAGPLRVLVTAPEGPEQAGDALGRVPEGVDVAGLEVAVPEGMDAGGFLAAAAVFGPDVPVYVELPRDGRRAGFVRALAGTGRFRAKFRTGGAVPDAVPPVAELATGIRLVVEAGVPFKATAGLHHAVRGPDPDTGFVTHGFANLLLATHAALTGGDVEGALGIGDGAVLARALAALTGGEAHAVRAAFSSFGTCSVADPLTDLDALGLLPAGHA